jgi:hypothetical protein
MRALHSVRTRFPRFNLGLLEGLGRRVILVCKRHHQKQLSIFPGLWFGTRRSKVQILSPRPLSSSLSAFRLPPFPGALFLSFLGRCFRLLLDSGTNLNRMHVLLLHFDFGRTAFAVSTQRGKIRSRLAQMQTRHFLSRPDPIFEARLIFVCGEGSFPYSPTSNLAVPSCIFGSQ